MEEIAGDIEVLVCVSVEQTEWLEKVLLLVCVGVEQTMAGESSAVGMYKC